MTKGEPQSGSAIERTKGWQCGEHGEGRPIYDSGAIASSWAHARHRYRRSLAFRRALLDYPHGLDFFAKTWPPLGGKNHRSC